jgi:hypothetical protein
MVTSSQKVEASLFCCNSEFDGLHYRELLVRKHESDHLASERGNGFVRLIAGCLP